ncbi:hypothetical protein FIV38_27450 [Pseudomonas proteolytica]|nr:hypothetical protein F4W61_10310 [Pseudomonas proteolytica]TWR73629.1 hypothetical protein FIV38_27450 [Pseudomonas proteolytica]
MVEHKKMWERACPRMQWISRYICRLILRIREQARSHIGSSVVIETTTRSTDHSSPGSPASA